MVIVIGIIICAIIIYSCGIYVTCKAINFFKMIF